MLRIETAENGRHFTGGNNEAARDLQAASERRLWRAKEIA
jgi:hypothetical protein